MPIALETMIRALYPAFEGTNAKVHLAQSNGREHPLDVFYEGTFDLWQATQNKKNFSRDLVIGLIETDRPEVWLFAGLWRRQGEPVWGKDLWEKAHGLPTSECWLYDLQPVTETEPLAGRLHIRFNKSTRGNYRLFESIAAELTVSSLMESPRGFPRFSGYRNVHLAMTEVRVMYSKTPEDWQTALAAVGGVYLITDGEGRHYVGSAYGVDGFWGRWRAYADTGHGGNKKLKDILGSDPRAASQGFSFAILETADTSATKAETIRRESPWKSVLGSRAVGLNLN